MSAELSSADFRFVQGTGFFVACLLTLQAWLNLIGDRCDDRTLRRLARLACLTLAIALAYSVLGAVASSVGNSAVGFRNATAALMAVLIGADVGRTWDYRTIAIGFLFSVVLGLALTTVEIIAPVEYYRAISAVSFTNLKLNPSSRSIGTRETKIPQLIDKYIDLVG
jgi:hypothetical protein